MTLPPVEEAPLGLGSSLRSRGFERLTPVQAAVLNPELEGRDLRIASQTGSGKTVALGFVLSSAFAGERPKSGTRGPARPAVLVVAPTRELAGQLGRELGWLYRSLEVAVAVVTGGTSIDDERRTLARSPHLVVGTPGRLLDHLRRGALALDQLESLVLDEADEMLDMGFEEELEALIAETPEIRRTHLVSATFGPRALAVARRVQTDSVEVRGSAPSKGHDDIDQVRMSVRLTDRVAAVINLLLRYPDDKTLIFVRTRSDTHTLAQALADLGFRAHALSGEMTQRERTRTFAAFRAGDARILVATDVAARGLDVDDIRRVIQFDLPQNADVLTHRSGRTGRAGRAGENVLLVPPNAERRVTRLLLDARIEAAPRPAPGPQEVYDAANTRLVTALAEQSKPDEATRAFASKLLEGADPADVVAFFLDRSNHAGPCDPRPVAPPAKAKRADHTSRARRSTLGDSDDFVTFQVSWGARHGADPRRLLALVCRRGQITRGEVGAIDIAPTSSTVQVAKHRATSFESRVARPDARDPRVRFRRWAPPVRNAAQRSRRPKAHHRGRPEAPSRRSA